MKQDKNTRSADYPSTICRSYGAGADFRRLFRTTRKTILTTKAMKKMKGHKTNNCLMNANKKEGQNFRTKVRMVSPSDWR